MKTLIQFLILCSLIFCISCEKKECINNSMIFSCLIDFFPDKTYDLSLISNENDTLTYIVDTIIQESSQFESEEENECYIRESLKVTLSHETDNYKIELVAPESEFGRSFNVSFWDLNNSHESQFPVAVDVNCKLKSEFVSTSEGEVFYNSITINNKVYFKVIKKLNRFWDDENEDVTQFKFIYFSIRDGIIKLESPDKYWEKI